MYNDGEIRIETSIVHVKTRKKSFKPAECIKETIKHIEGCCIYFSPYINSLSHELVGIFLKTFFPVREKKKL